MYCGLFGRLVDDTMSGEHVLICVAWPYANGPLHLGHVAGCYLPPDIQARFERALGNRVLMVSGSDEHGTPITVTAETNGVSPQDVVDKYHAINNQALLNLGCTWEPNQDPRGIEFGGSLFNRTSDPEHHKYVIENFQSLMEAGLFEKKTMQQYYEIRDDGGRFLPDRYVEGECPHCGEDGARGDQCDECGITYEAHELKNPSSKMNPGAKIEIRDTEHFFYRLDLFQSTLEQHASERQKVWKSNVRAMTKQWLEMGLRSRAVTRDLQWGIPLPLEGEQWHGKCIYVWFEAVQGYYSCARLWAERYGGSSDWEKWWKIGADGTVPRHLYFLGKDNIPFHTVIWPAIIMGLNHANKGLDSTDPIRLPGPGDLALEANVPAMEYLMLAGGQFSKSRKHAVWLPSFLERFDPDTLRYYLAINMPENHDTDFNWPDFVEKINSELIGAYGNFVHRVLTLGQRLTGPQPLGQFEDNSLCELEMEKLEQIHADITLSLSRHRFKEALRFVMTASQLGNQMLQSATPWKHLKDSQSNEAKESLAKLSFGWRIARFLAITTQPFLPFSAQRLWVALGEKGEVSQSEWAQAIDWNIPMKWNPIEPTPLFTRLDLEEILADEQALVSTESTNNDPTHGVKGGKKSTKEEKKMPEGITYLNFETFMEVELRVGKIISVEDHANADKLYVVKLDDGTADGRTICAGLKEYYQASEMVGKSVVFVANLKPRKLRGIMSEGMMLAADDDNGIVRLLTIDGDISTGSLVR
ncbi:MAG TPA: methionine--tRNA ligase [Candidatus Poseidoniales archaeon]|nr:MAG: methionine--tRNA ligase [Euryarchaeota archaeon]HIF46557.1 methionine--tRNA ligase [Candidatus Poseidoniales archaeon]HIL64942.1 methionine--tRNA ligase [Candidatus Poseidoniales archaeon]